MNPRDPSAFDIDATFYERENEFFEGYVAFVSVNVTEVYLVYNNSGLLSVEQFENSTGFRERASFMVADSENADTDSVLNRRKRNPGESMFSITHSGE